jgi:putative thioredoxin
MTSDYIITVTEADFEYEVIAYSKQVPVIVDFWAEWCRPCKTLGPILERLTDEAQGTFRLAKVDVDANPNLALRFSVRSIPMVKAFRDSQMVAEFVGAQPEPRVREFLGSIAPSQTDLVLEKGLSRLASQDWKEADEAFQTFLIKFPDHPTASLGLLKCAIIQNKVDAAREMLRGFPASKEYASAELLRPLIEALSRTPTSPAYSEDPLEAAYNNALRLIRRGNHAAAMDGLLEILRQERRYRKDEVRRMLIGLFEIFGADSPLTRQYQAELASILF